MHESGGEDPQPKKPSLQLPNVVFGVGIGLVALLLLASFTIDLGSKGSAVALMLVVAAIGGMVLYALRLRRKRTTSPAGPAVPAAASPPPVQVTTETLPGVGSAASPLVVLDVADLESWEGESVPSLVWAAGDPSLPESIEGYCDMSLVGPDAQLAAIRYNIPGQHLYDVPAHRVDPYLQRFAGLQEKHHLAADLVVEPQRASHTTRAERAALLGGRAFALQDRQAVALPVEEEVRPVAGRSPFEGGEDHLSYLEIPLHADAAGSVASSEVVGSFTSPSGVVVLAGTDVLSAWRTPAGSEDSYEVRAEGSGALDAAARYDGVLVRSDVAVWRALDAAATSQLAAALRNWWSHMSGTLHVTEGPVTFLSDVSLRTSQQGSLTLETSSGPLLLVSVPAGVPLRVVAGLDSNGWVVSYRLVPAA